MIKQSGTVMFNAVLRFVRRLPLPLRRLAYRFGWFWLDVWARMRTPQYWCGHVWRAERLSVAYKQFLSGKRVALIGPAPYMDELMQGDVIDSYDVVVRMNAALPLREEGRARIGRRTDVLYHCMAELYTNRTFTELVDNWEIGWICSSYPNTKWYTKENMSYLRAGNSTPFRLIPRNVYKQVCANMQTCPNTGTMAIADLLAHDIEELYISGFSFQLNTYSEISRVDASVYPDDVPIPLPEAQHDQEEQRHWLQSKVASDCRIKVDSCLGEILK